MPEAIYKKKAKRLKVKALLNELQADIDAIIAEMDDLIRLCIPGIRGSIDLNRVSSTIVSDSSRLLNPFPVCHCR